MTAMPVVERMTAEELLALSGEQCRRAQLASGEIVMDPLAAIFA